MDIIDMTRPINPSDVVRNENIYLTDQDFVFGNSEFKYIESLGVDPDVHRTLHIEDLEEGLMDNALDILETVHAHAAGISAKEIQVALNKENSLRRARVFISEDPNLATKGITNVVAEFREQTAAFIRPVEEEIKSWLTAYTKLFDSLEELEKANLVPHEAWDLIAIPLPKELAEADPILKTATRKDVVLRRLEEIQESGALKHRPNMLALVKNLLKNAQRIDGFFHFNEPCELLFK